METLSWEALQLHIASKLPTMLAMGGTKGVRLGFDPATARLMVRLPVAPGAKAAPSNFSELEVAVRQDESGSVLEVSTGAERLYREFHRFAGLLAEDLELPGRSAFDAFDAAIDRWQELASPKSILSPDQQLGLYGELMFLAALVTRDGPRAIGAWTGRNENAPGRHDFRFGRLDIEIKTTRSANRRHVVHGLTQFSPSAGHDLFVLSIRLEAAGLATGRALGARVSEIYAALGESRDARMEFETKLASAGYRDAESTHYREELRLADMPILVPVDSRCPKIVPQTLVGSMPPDVSGRIDEVSYRVDLGGLGAAQGTTSFKAVLGKISLE